MIKNGHAICQGWTILMKSLSWDFQIIVFFILKEIWKTNWDEIYLWKKKVNVEIKKFSINTRSSFDTKWKKMKKIMHYLEKVGERYFEIGNFPIKIFL